MIIILADCFPFNSLSWDKNDGCLHTLYFYLVSMTIRDYNMIFDEMGGKLIDTFYNYFKQNAEHKVCVKNVALSTSYIT